MPNDVDPCEIRASEASDEGCCTAGCTAISKMLSDHPDLHSLLKAWPILPDPIRAGVLALVNAATSKGAAE